MSIPNTIKGREFIEAYRSHVCLWNSSDDRYKNKNLRNKAYADLLKFYKEIDPESTLDQMKKKINNIRCSYQREIKKVLQSEKSGAGPSLWYFHELQCLRDLEIPLKTTSSISESGILDKYDDSESLASSLTKSAKKKDIGFTYFFTFLERATDHLAKSKDRDEASIFSESWACSFRTLAPMQKLFAKRAIEEILLQGQLNCLEYDTVKSPCTLSHQSNSQSSSYMQDSQGPSPHFETVSRTSSQSSFVDSPYFMPTPEPSPESPFVRKPASLLHFVSVPKKSAQSSQRIGIAQNYNNMIELIQDEQFS